MSVLEIVTVTTFSIWDWVWSGYFAVIFHFPTVESKDMDQNASVLDRPTTRVVILMTFADMRRSVAQYNSKQIMC